MSEGPKDGMTEKRKDRTTEGQGESSIAPTFSKRGYNDKSNQQGKICAKPTEFFLFVFELMFYVPVNSSGHVGTLPALYGTFTQNKDVITSNKTVLKI